MSHHDELSRLKTQVDLVQSALQEAQKTIEQVQHCIQSLESERREHRRALLETLPEGPEELTSEEMEDMRKNGVTWSVIEQDLKSVFGE